MVMHSVTVSSGRKLCDRQRKGKRNTGRRTCRDLFPRGRIVTIQITVTKARNLHRRCTRTSSKSGHVRSRQGTHHIMSFSRAKFYDTIKQSEAQFRDLNLATSGYKQCCRILQFRHFASKTEEEQSEGNTVQRVEQRRKRLENRRERSRISKAIADADRKLLVWSSHRSFRFVNSYRRVVMSQKSNNPKYGVYRKGKDKKQASVSGSSIQLYIHKLSTSPITFSKSFASTIVTAGISIFAFARHLPC